MTKFASRKERFIDAEFSIKSSVKSERVAISSKMVAWLVFVYWLKMETLMLLTELFMLLLTEFDSDEMLLKIFLWFTNYIKNYWIRRPSWIKLMQVKNFNHGLYRQSLLLSAHSKNWL